MIGLIGLGILIILLIPYFKENKYEQIERMQSLRRSTLKVQAKYRRFSL